jgi:hypothetical protein
LRVWGVDACVRVHSQRAAVAVAAAVAQPAPVPVCPSCNKKFPREIGFLTLYTLYTLSHNH